MQTFLPYPNFVASVMCFDTARLGKQRVEARQLQTAIQNGGAWSHHPAAKMWKNNITALMLYGDCAIREWVRRGYVNNMPLMIARSSDTSDMYGCVSSIEMPPWLGDEAFHASHRSNLLRKDPSWYGSFGWEEEPDMPYVWPKS